jgi:hypothetical protein
MDAGRQIQGQRILRREVDVFSSFFNDGSGSHR